MKSFPARIVGKNRQNISTIIHYITSQLFDLLVVPYVCLSISYRIFQCDSCATSSLICVENIQF